MDYKISEVSQMIDIPIDTIRFYEKRGIITPIRRGKYRYFSEEDIYLLCEYKKMRSYGLGLDEIKSFTSEARMNDFTELFAGLEEDYKRKIQYYQALKKIAESSVTILGNAEASVGKYQMTEISPKYYIDFYQRDNDKEMQIDVWRSWVHEYYPFVEYITVLDLANGESENITENSMWVNAIDRDIVNELNIPVNEYVKVIPRKKALYTVVNRYDEKLIDEKYINEINTFLKENGLTLDGQIIGKMIARIKEGEKFLRYIGLWIPIK